MTVEVMGFQDGVASTTTPPGIDLTNGLVLRRVDSRITGRRLVSLLFADFTASRS